LEPIEGWRQISHDSDVAFAILGGSSPSDLTPPPPGETLTYLRETSVILGPAVAE
jgi:hypothetical protein